MNRANLKNAGDELLVREGFQKRLIDGRDLT